MDNRYYHAIGQAYAESTSAAHRSKWVTFIDFLCAHKLQVIPPSYMNIARFLVFYTQRVEAYSSVQNMVSSIKKFYSIMDYHIDTSHPVLDLYLKSAKRTMSARSQPKAPIQLGHIMAIASTLDSKDPKMLAFFTALLIQFYACLRVSNLVPASATSLSSIRHLRRCDLVPTTDALVLTLPWTKTLQSKEDIFTIPIARMNDVPLDPVSAYEYFIRANPAPPRYPAFTFKSAGQLSILTVSMYSELLRKAIIAIGLPPQAYTTHSVRRGSASLLFELRVPNRLIKNHGTWRSECYNRYIHVSHAQKLIPTKAILAYASQKFK